MIRPLLLFLVLFTAFAVAPRSIFAAADAGIVISGGDLPHSVRLTAADEDAFSRRINTPPRLDNKPDGATGQSYTLNTQYWNTILSRPGRPAVDSSATYYAESGVVRAEQGGKDAWLVLDLRQRAILSRYIRLTKDGSLSARPGLLSVLTAAVSQEDITVEVDGGALAADQVGQLWGALAGTGDPQFLDPVEPPLTGMSGYWIVFGMEEGRAVQLYYQPGSPGKLTDSIGGERYEVSPALAGVLDGVKPTAHNINDPSTGSYAWWPIGLGLGVICLAGALWFSRHRFPLPSQIEALIDRFSPPHA